jgi:hypothetical protein
MATPSGLVRRLYAAWALLAIAAASVARVVKTLGLRPDAK